MSSWVIDVTRFRHDTFLVFVDCKINNKGNWQPANVYDDQTGYTALRVIDNSEHNTISIVQPEGIRRDYLVRMGGSISMYQNVISFNSEFVSDLIVDEKAKSGKGKTRDILE